MTAAALARRRLRLAAELAPRELDAAVVAGAGLLKLHGPLDWLLGGAPSMRSAVAVVEPDGRTTAFVGGEADAAQLPREQNGYEVRVASPDVELAAAAAAHVRGLRRRHGRIGLLGAGLAPDADRAALRAALAPAEPVDLGPLAARLRARKEADELEALREAAAIAAAAHGRLVAAARPGARPAELAALAHAEARRLGARETVVFVGAGLHHGPPASEPLSAGALATVYVEVLGPDGAWAEEVGMVALGALDERRERLAETVLASLTAAERALRPGAATATVAAAATAPARARELETALCHSLGHGVGAGDEDLPRIAEADAGRLERAMALVLHPNLVDRALGVSATAGGTYVLGASGGERLAPVPALTRTVP